MVEFLLHPFDAKFAGGRFGFRFSFIVNKVWEVVSVCCVMLIALGAGLDAISSHFLSPPFFIIVLSSSAHGCLRLRNFLVTKHNL